MRKTLYAFVAAASLSGTLMAQNPGGLEKCATQHHLNAQLQQSPALMQQMEAAEAAARAWRMQHPHGNTQRTVLTIPVVVHVVYKDATQNISDAQIQSQIDVLNQDYRRRNADTVKTRDFFDSLATDMEIEFCLAQRDPQGNPTNGITRTQTAGGTFLGYFSPFNDDVKSSATGGVDAWPADQYLNLWVCDLFPIVLGYAQFPGGAPATDGVVIGYSYFGTMGTVQPPYQGRTASHEVGHWLGLRHIWGDGACGVEDSVPDTPDSDDSNYGCLLNRNACVDAPYDYPDMVENYMDYSDDTCMNMFTHGQKARAWSFLNTARAGLFTSQGCQTVVNRDAETPAAFSVYPNPSHGLLNLDWNGNAPVQVRVTDLTGRAVWASGKELPPGVHTLDLRGQAAGIYLLELQQGSSTQRHRIRLY